MGYLEMLRLLNLNTHKNFVLLVVSSVHLPPSSSYLEGQELKAPPEFDTLCPEMSVLLPREEKPLVRDWRLDMDPLFQQMS
jgi:hypothetical protein